MFRLLVIGIATLVAAGLVVFLYGGGQPAGQAAAAPAQMVSIIVTATPVRAGNLLQPGELTSKSMPADEVPAGAHRDAPEARAALVGAMVRRMLDQQEPITGDDVLRPGDRGFLAAVLKPGMRAVSVAVDAVTGAAGLIWPGDRVDLILTQTIDNGDQSPARRVAGEIVLADVQVIAVDQQLVQGGQASGVLEPHGATSRTITLEVTQEEASRIAVASNLGRLQVALRAAQPAPQPSAPEPPAPQPSAAKLAVLHPSELVSKAGVTTVSAEKSGTPVTSSPVWAGDVSHALAPTPGERAREVHVYEGGKAAEVYKF